MFVPLTTRTPAQYERILLREKLSYRYALVCNGALLLDNGISDAAWEQESLAMTADCAEPLAQALADLYTFAETEHVHDLRPYMVYAKTEATPQQIATLHQRYTPHRDWMSFSAAPSCIVCRRNFPKAMRCVGSVTVLPIRLIV